MLEGTVELDDAAGMEDVGMTEAELVGACELEGREVGFGEGVTVGHGVEVGEGNGAYSSKIFFIS